MSLLKKWFGKSDEKEDKKEEETETSETSSEVEVESADSQDSAALESDGDEEEPEAIREEDLDASELYIPRVLYFKAFGSNPGSCPRCRSKVDNQDALYAIIVHNGSEETLMVMNANLGWFCSDCPTMFMNPDKLHGALRYNLEQQNEYFEGFVPLGLVDPDELPENPEEENDEDEPLPVIPFTDLRTFGKGSSRVRTPGSKKGKKKKKKKKR